MERRSLFLILLFVVFSKATQLLQTANDICFKSVSLNVHPNSIDFYYSDPEWQDDGVDHDQYSNHYQCTPLSQTQLETASQQFDEQNPSAFSLLLYYFGTYVSTQNRFERTRSKIRRPDQRFKNHRVYGLRTWLPVRMLSAFTYIGAIYTNHQMQGLLHTFLRRWDAWRNFIAGVDTGMGNFANVQYQLDSIQRAYNNTVSRSALNKFDYIQQGLPAPDFNQLEDNLHDMQMLIYRFLLQNVNDHTYMGRSINNIGQLQEFFRVTDRYGRQRVMVICLSNQLYPRDPNFGDSRNIRTITTIYFLNYADAVSRIVTYTTTTEQPHVTDELK